MPPRSSSVRQADFLVQVRECLEEYIEHRYSCEIPLTKNQFLKQAHRQQKYLLVKKTKFFDILSQLQFGDNNVLNLQQVLNSDIFVLQGRKPTLDSATEKIFAERLLTIVNKTNLVLTKTLISVELIHFINNFFPDNEKEKLMQRSGKRW
jgi:S-adenosylmethionine:tRNA-ribosyltransferase-isomerase (queuine synthetase)